MPNLEKTFSINKFQGLDERMQLGESLQLTSSLDNVIVRNGNVKGRKGIALWDSISSAATNQIVGFGEFYAPATVASSLIRMQTLAVDKWNSSSHAWDDITGTALAGDTSTRPCFYTMSDEGFMVFTNEGHDRPRKYTGSGNTAVLGGTPPYAKWLCPYVGFLFLFNTSPDGSFSAIADSITAYFSDVPDGSWDLCAGNTIIYDESPGEIRGAQVLNETLLVGKADCFVSTRFAVGVTRFSRKKLPSSLGLLAPLSYQLIGEFGAIFLATDRNLYQTDGFSVKPLPPKVQRSLQEVMAAAKAPYASAFVDHSQETYHLLFSRNSSTYFDGRLSFNYRTGEFYRSVYTGYEFTRGFAYRQSNNVASQQIVAANDKKVYELENGTDDAGTAVTRFYDIDWNQYGGSGSKFFTGANLVFTTAGNVQVRISVASDHLHIFQFPRMYSLKGKFPSDTNTRVKYELPSPIYGSWFKLRIEMFHYGATNQVELQEVSPITIQVSSTPQDESKQSYAQRA